MAGEPSVTVERSGSTAHARLRGDLVVTTARPVFGTLRELVRSGEVRDVVLDFTGAGRIDSSGIAVVALVGEELARSGKHLELVGLADRHRAAFEARREPVAPPPPPERIGTLERLGESTYAAQRSVVALARLVGETAHQSGAVVAHRRRLPPDAIVAQISRMGVDAVGIVGLLAFLIGVTMAYQGALQLQRIGAGVFVADLIGVAIVRELSPLITAVILTGRTGAAIAAELGTMKVRSEIDALAVMGISPVRYLIVPRLAAITFVVPALTLFSMVVAIVGGMGVASLVLAMPPEAYWLRIVERVTLWDYVHGLGKSFVFAWIIGFAGAHLGLRAGPDARSVGAATTRTVVASVFAIIVADAVFASLSTHLRYG